jgi:pimeloyl-ACP methyl ester carboxylesterase
MKNQIRSMKIRSIKIQTLVMAAFTCSSVFWLQVGTARETWSGNPTEYGTVLQVLPTQENGMHSEDVMIYSHENDQSDKKIARKGRLTSYPDARATILIAHGYMCDKYDVGFLRSLFGAKHYNFMTFDFRGHGEQGDGQCCTFGRDEAFDVIAAVKFLRSHPATKNKPLFVYAFSMGAVASIEAQAKEKLFDAMVLDCPFDASESIVKRCLETMKLSVFGYNLQIPGRALLEKYAFHPYVQSTIKTLLRAISQIDHDRISTVVYSFSPAESAKKIDVPCFFIHCKNDEKVPVSAAKTLYANVIGPKQLWITNGRHHYDSYFYNPEEYSKRVGEFIDQVLMKEWKDRTKQIVREDSSSELVI